MATEERKDNKKPFKGVSTIQQFNSFSIFFFRLRSSGLQTCPTTCSRTLSLLRRRLLMSTISKPMVSR